MERPNKYVHEYEERLGQLPSGTTRPFERIEFVDPNEPEKGYRLIEGWKLSLTDGVPIPEEPIDDI